jgi:hypothetical protein
MIESHGGLTIAGARGWPAAFCRGGPRLPSGHSDVCSAHPSQLPPAVFISLRFPLELAPPPRPRHSHMWGVEGGGDKMSRLTKGWRVGTYTFIHHTCCYSILPHIHVSGVWLYTSRHFLCFLTVHFHTPTGVCDCKPTSFSCCVTVHLHASRFVWLYTYTLLVLCDCTPTHFLCCVTVHLHASRVVWLCTHTSCVVCTYTLKQFLWCCALLTNSFVVRLNPFTHFLCCMTVHIYTLPVLYNCTHMYNQAHL